jgi:hypothetical protein
MYRREFIWGIPYMSQETLEWLTYSRQMGRQIYSSTTLMKHASFCHPNEIGLIFFFSFRGGGARHATDSISADISVIMVQNW